MITMKFREKVVTGILIAILVSANDVYLKVIDNLQSSIETESGRVRGHYISSRSGKDILAFTKIPYGKPPIGNLRFKPVDPDVKWEGTYDAVEDLPDCLQIPVFDVSAKQNTLGTEDCLYLSVFKPAAATKDAKLPVMIFIHGGGWRSELPPRGTQGDTSKYLLDEDIILVTFHYRLGPLGFLSTEDDALPGNLGLKDQVQVIKWVKKNIASFGGDPDKITLFGNSAGAASTHYHLISPLSKDLVHGGISQSGTATCLWAFTAPGTALEKAKGVARHLGCPEQPSEELVSCLRTKPAVDITNSEKLYINRDFDPPIVFQPVIEKGPNAFLPDSPYNLKVEKPWIVGFNSEDGGFKLLHYAMDPELMESLKKDGLDILPDALMFTNTTEDPKHIANAVLEFYDMNDQTKFTEMWTDGYFVHGADQGLARAAETSYLYLYAYRGNTSITDVMATKVGKKADDYGVCHTDELLSLFDLQYERGPLLDEDRKVSERVVKLWVDFATNGYPKSREDWKPYKDKKCYLKISKEDTVEHDLWPSRMNFWRNLPIRNAMENKGV